MGTRSQTIERFSPGVRAGWREAEHPVLFFANGFGDHLLALPAVRALGQLFSGRLTFVGMRHMRQTFFPDVPFRAAYGPSMTAIEDGRIFNAASVAREIVSCDLFLSLNPWHSWAVDELLAALAPDVSAGFNAAFDAALACDETIHAADLAFALPRAIAPALYLNDFAAPPAIPPTVRLQVDPILRTVPAERRVLVVHADTAKRKQWPAAAFDRTLERFLTQHPEFVVFLVGQADIGITGGNAAKRVVPFLGLPLTHGLALLRRADLFLGIDSVMLHAADLLRVPGVGLYRQPADAIGLDSSVTFGFRFAPHRHVCGDGTMAAISEADVLDALDAMAAYPR